FHPGSPPLRPVAMGCRVQNDDGVAHGGRIGMVLFLKLRLRKVSGVGRLRRVAIWLGAAAVGIAAIALLVVNLYVQSKEAQASIEQELSRRLGTPLKIRSVSVTPWGGLTLSGITIPQPSPVTSADFLEAKSFHLHIRFIPLFSRRLIIKEVSLLGPNVVWAQNAEGKWRLPGARGGGLADEAPESDAASVPPVAGNAGPTP